MEYVCTSCCKEKKENEGLLPATQRYISERIEYVYKEGKRLNTPFIILSGKYGFIDSDLEIPWYDQALEPEDVESFIPLLIEQLREKGVSKIIFYGKPKSTPSWEPYYDALENSCNQLNIPITYHWVDLD